MFFSLLCCNSAFVLSVNRAFTLFRAMVIGKSADVYEELYEFYFRTAATNGLVGPLVRTAAGHSDSPVPQRASFVLATMDFETAQHHGFISGGCSCVWGAAWGLPRPRARLWRLL